MLNFRFLLINIFLILASNSFGQSPGYLGKRLFVEGNIGVNAGLDFLNIANDNEDGTNNYTVFRPVAKVSANWVYNRYRYISLEVGYQQFSSRQSALLRFAGQPSLRYRLSTQSVGLGFYKTSRKKTRSLSPLGFYFGYKVNFSRSSATPIKYADTKEKFEGVEKAAYNLIYEKPKLNFFGLAVSSGFRTVLKDKFTINYAFDFGFDFPLGEYSSCLLYTSPSPRDRG